MEIRESARRRAGVWLFCLAVAAALLLICTKSSPLYPLNDWEDANIFFTMGKGMLRGKVLYRDLYDQKGPLLYLLYGLASLVSPASFFGVYLLETLSFAAFLYGCYRLLGLFTRENRLFVLPVLGTLILSSMAMTHGGSVEELCLPVFLFSLTRMVRYFGFERPGSMPYRDVFLHGFLAGCVLFSKFTLLGFYIGWMGVLAVSLAANGQWKRAILSCLAFLATMAASALPWIAYFGINRALPDFFQCYFYNNIFQYSELSGAPLLTRVLTIGRHTLATFFRNAQYSLFTVLGIFWFTFGRRAERKPWLIAALWSAAVLTDGFIYIGGIGFRYYGLILACFAPLGAVPLLIFYNARLAGKPFFRRFGRALPAALTVLGLGVSLAVSDNAYFLAYSKEDTPQYRFAAVMEETAEEKPVTLLNRGFLDGGFYLAADVVPDCRFFTALNLDLPELGAEQARFESEALTEFMVTRDRELTSPRYRLVAEADLWYEDYDRHYRLYQRVS